MTLCNLFGSIHSVAFLHVTISTLHAFGGGQQEVSPAILVLDEVEAVWCGIDMALAFSIESGMTGYEGGVMMTMKKKSGLLVVAVASLFVAISAQAATIYWNTDAGSGNWNDTAKWSTSAVPGIYDTAYFTRVQAAPFTVSFTNNASSKLTLGSSDAAKPVVMTFDLNGYTFTHTNGTLEVNRAADWTLLDGTLYLGLGAGAFLHGYYQTNYTPKVTIGAGGVMFYNPTNTATYMQIGSRSEADFVIQDGGRLITQPTGNETMRMGASTTAGHTNYTATMTITGSGSVWSNRAGSVALGSTALAKAALNVENGGLLVHSGTVFYVGNVTGGNGSMTISSGGVFDARWSPSYLSIGNNGTGTVTVTGTGSKLLLSTNNLYLANTANTSDGTLIVENGGLVEKADKSFTLYIGYRDGTTGRVIVRDGGELRWVGGSGNTYVGGGAGSAAGASGELTITGATSKVLLGEFGVGQNRGNALVTVAGGGTLEIFKTMYVGRINTNSVTYHNGLAKLVVTGTNSVLKKSALTSAELPNSSLSATTSLGIGGCGFQGWNNSGLLYYSSGTYGSGGKGAVVIENGGLLTLNGYIGVYTNSTLRIDGGRTQCARIGLETNAVLTVALRAGDANGTALMTATTDPLLSAEVRIWGAKLDVELGQDFRSVAGDVYTLISGPLHATINRFTYGGEALEDGAVIQVGGTSFKVGYSATDVTLTVRRTGTMIRVL
jgi:T5SS/PEP-CTERM-associated repeat protein